MTMKRFMKNVKKKFISGESPFPALWIGDKKMILRGKEWGIPKGYCAEYVPTSKKGTAVFAVKKLRDVM